jgi:hypothetical protein
MSERKIRNLIVRLTGQKLPIKNEKIKLGPLFKGGNKGIGYNQLNEILLMFGYDRISPSFFKFLIQLSGVEIAENPKKDAIGEPDVVTQPLLIKSLEQFEYLVESFNIVALLAYGNIKYAFKTLATNKEQVKYCQRLSSTKNIDCYTKRQNPAKKTVHIKSNDTYYLGYLIQDDIDTALEKNPSDKYWKAEEKKMLSAIKKGEYNNDTYLVSDYMDVYVATSMREKHEFILTYNFVKTLFEKDIIRDLNLRYFDPTQAYCEDRIDKGLTEALMLKIAACTIYLVQEKDTFGKDSELASTLAQGKPVIAYVPHGDKKYADKLLKIIENVNPKGKDKNKLILEYLSIFEPELAWIESNSELRDWINNPTKADSQKLLSLFYKAVEEIYDSRAKTLQTRHPLGIQIELSSGIACGVLVVRDIDACAKLLRRVIINQMRFNIDPTPDAHFALPIEKDTIKLVEEISGSVYRIMSKNQILSNTFWNLYKSNFN